MKSAITVQEERVYRLRHHNFEGLTTQETAKKMKISLKKVRRLLKNLQAKAPQLFPILTHRQHVIYWLYVDKGVTEQEIADYLNILQSSVSRIISGLREKGVIIPEHWGHGDIISLEDLMDENVDIISRRF